MRRAVLLKLANFLREGISPGSKIQNTIMKKNFKKQIDQKKKFKTNLHMS